MEGIPTEWLAVDLRRLLKRYGDGGGGDREARDGGTRVVIQGHPGALSVSTHVPSAMRSFASLGVDVAGELREIGWLHSVPESNFSPSVHGWFLSLSPPPFPPGWGEGGGGGVHVPQGSRRILRCQRILRFLRFDSCLSGPEGNHE